MVTVTFIANEPDLPPLGITCADFGGYVNPELELELDYVKFEHEDGSCVGIKGGRQSISWSQSTTNISPGSVTLVATEKDLYEDDTFSTTLLITRNDIVELMRLGEITKDLESGFGINFKMEF